MICSNTGPILAYMVLFNIFCELCKRSRLVFLGKTGKKKTTCVWVFPLNRNSSTFRDMKFIKWYFPFHREKKNMTSYLPHSSFPACLPRRIFWAICFQWTTSFSVDFEAYFWYRFLKTADLGSLQKLLPQKLQGLAVFWFSLPFSAAVFFLSIENTFSSQVYCFQNQN